MHFPKIYLLLFELDPTPPPHPSVFIMGKSGKNEVSFDWGGLLTFYNVFGYP